MMFNFEINSQDFLALLNHALLGYSKKDAGILAFRISEEKKSLEMIGQTSVSHFLGSMPLLELDGDGLSSMSWQTLNPEDTSSLSKILKKDEKDPEETILVSCDSHINKDIKVSSSSFYVYMRTKEGDMVREVEPYEELCDVGGKEFISDLFMALKFVEPAMKAYNRASSCLHLYLLEDGYKMMGTDTFTLLEKERKYPGLINEKALEEKGLPHGEEHPILIRESELRALRPALESSSLTLLLSKHKFGVKDNKGFISLVGLADEPYPVLYQPVLDAVSEECFVIFEMPELKKMLYKVSSVNPDGGEIIFTFRGNKALCESGDKNKKDKFKTSLLDTSLSDKEEIRISFPRRGFGLILSALNISRFVRFDFPRTISSSVIKVSPLNRQKELSDKSLFIGIGANA